MPGRLRTRIEEVTSRQLEVARLVAEGRTNPEIASDLGITLDGAKYHVSELLGRLGLERREEIADWYRTERPGQSMRRFSALFASAPKAFATAAAVTAVAAVGVLFVVALEGGRAQDETVFLAPSVTSVAEAGVPPPVGAVGDATDLPEELDLLPFLLRQRIRDTPVTVVSWERIDWRDGCFELPPDDGCPLSLSPVPGYRVVLNVAGAEYIARTSVEVDRYALEAGPPIPPFTAVYEWTGFPFGGGLPCAHIRLGANGIGTFAGCGEAPTPLVLGPSGVALQRFFDHIQERLPITLEETPATRSQLRTSTDRPLVEWGRYLAIEAFTGRASAALGVAVGWSDDNADGCSGVRVMQYGAVHLDGCAGGTDGIVFLDEDGLSRLYQWIDGYQPFEVSGTDTYLTFSGTGGTTPANDEVRDDIGNWISALAEAGPTDVE